MRKGKILRFEELTRCPQEIQDSMISILSEKVVTVPELGPEESIYCRVKADIFQNERTPAHELILTHVALPR